MLFSFQSCGIFLFVNIFLVDIFSSDCFQPSLPFYFSNISWKQLLQNIIVVFKLRTSVFWLWSLTSSYLLWLLIYVVVSFCCLIFSFIYPMPSFFGASCSPIFPASLGFFSISLFPLSPPSIFRNHIQLAIEQCRG